MAIYKLNGVFIANAIVLEKEFDAAEILRDGEQFIRFANTHLKNRSDIACYHAYMLQAAYERRHEPGVIKKAEDYWNNPYAITILEDAVNSALTLYRKEPASSAVEQARQRTKAVFAAVMSIPDLSEAEKRYAFCFLSAAYLLVGLSPQDKPIDPTKLPYALRCASASSTEAPVAPQPDLSNIDGDSIFLPVSKEAYRYALYADASLPDDARIRTVKVLATNASHGGRYLTAKLEFYRSETGPVVSTVELHPGEYVYLNVACGRVTSVLPTCSENGAYQLCRRQLCADKLYLTGADGFEKALPPQQYVDASSFAAESGTPGYLIVRKGRLDISGYTDRYVYTQLEAVSYKTVVEVALYENEFLILQDTGRVYSSNAEWNKLRKVPCLLQVIRNAGGLSQKNGGEQ